MSSLLDVLQGDGLSVRWIKAHLDYPHKDWCLTWPFGKSTSGYGRFGRPPVRVHRIMCEYKNGPAPADRPQAAHECGHGHLACVNPNHVAWKSHGENMVDMYKHGSKQGKRYKLTPSQVDEIRALEGRSRLSDIAEQFGVHIETIRQIFSGKAWKQTRTDIHVFTAEELERIRAAAQANGVTKAFAKEFGVTPQTIQRIRSGKYHRWFYQGEPT